MSERQDDFQRRIEEQMEREMEEIEAELAAHPEITSMKADAKIKERVDQVIAEAEYEKIISQLPEEYQEDLRLGREVRKEQEHRNKRRVYAYWKKIGAAAAVVVLVAGLGITSVGGPKRVIEFFQSTVGGREVEKVVSTNNEDALEVEGIKEEEAYQQIKDELEIDPVKIMKLENDMIFKSVEIDPYMQMAYLIYSYEDRNISYSIQCLYPDGTWGSDIEDMVVDEYPYELEEGTATIKEYQRTDADMRKYVAKFEYKGVEYTLVGTMEWSEFEKLLNNLIFV